MQKKDLAHTPSPECGGDKGIRPSVPFGGKRSETKRYVISHATYCNDKAARTKERRVNLAITNNPKGGLFFPFRRVFA